MPHSPPIQLHLGHCGKTFGQLEQGSDRQRVVPCSVIDPIGPLTEVVPMTGVDNDFILFVAEGDLGEAVGALGDGGSGDPNLSGSPFEESKNVMGSELACGAVERHRDRLAQTVALW